MNHATAAARWPGPSILPKSPPRGRQNSARDISGEVRWQIFCHTGNAGRAGVKIQHAIFPGKFGGKSFDVLAIRMVRRQTVKAAPHFRQRDGGDEKLCRVLDIMPRHETGIGQRFVGFADRVGVQHEVQNWKGLTKSSGIRGGSQSVVRRTESCHASSFFMRRRAAALRRVGRGVFAMPFGCRASSQPNNSLAWRADSFLTFLTAISTALILDKLVGKIFCASWF